MSDQSSNSIPPKSARRKKILRGLGIASLLLLVIGIVQFWPRPHDALTRYIPKDALVVVKIEPYTFIANLKGHYKEIANSALVEKLSKEDSTACQLPKNPMKFGIDLQHTAWTRGGEIYGFTMADPINNTSSTHVVLALTNKNKFKKFLEAIFCQDTFTIDEGNNSSQLTMKDSSLLVTWDHKAALFTLNYSPSVSLDSMQEWARYRIENPDRKNCIEQHEDFKAFHKEAEEVAVFVNIEALTEDDYSYYSSQLALMEPNGLLSPTISASGMRSIQCQFTIDSGKFTLSSTFTGDIEGQGPFAFLAEQGLSKEASDNLHSSGNPQVAFSIALDMDTLYNNLDALVQEGLIGEQPLSLEEIDAQLGAFVPALAGKQWTIEELMTSLNGLIAGAVSIDLEGLQNLKPIDELNVHIGVVKGDSVLGKTVTELSNGIIQERGLSLDLLLENYSTLNAQYESIFVLPNTGRQLIKTLDGYTLILGMKDGLDSVNNVNGYNDDVDYFIRKAGYGENNAVDGELRALLADNSIALYISLNEEDYGPELSTITEDLLVVFLEDAEPSEQAIKEFANILSHFSVSVNSNGEMEMILALENTEDNPVVTIWQVLNRYAQELGMLD
ncbi:MAG TPA: hypothetical protein DEO99_08300 [Bacteroidetes bacterium]|nr:hypothetical protein [Bacteroidota bacterium]